MKMWYSASRESIAFTQNLLILNICFVKGRRRRRPTTMKDGAPEGKISKFYRNVKSSLAWLNFDSSKQLRARLLQS